jgi:hypothetical protein
LLVAIYADNPAALRAKIAKIRRKPIFFAAGLLALSGVLRLVSLGLSVLCGWFLFLRKMCSAGQ